MTVFANYKHRKDPVLREKYFMKMALEQAERAFANGEFPVGCVIEYQGEILVTGARTGTADGGANEIDHAEILALKQLAGLSQKIDKTRLTLFCTLEPCLMCFAATMLSGVSRIVYGYEDVMGGGTRCNPDHLMPLYKDHPMTILPNVLRKECLALFQAFFNNPANEYLKGSLLARHTLARAEKE